MDIQSFFTNLPNLISYLVIGFIFIRMYHYFLLIDNTINTEHILLESVAVGFILRSIMDPIISLIFKGRIQIVAEIVMVVIFAYLIKSVKNSDKFAIVLDKLKIRNTGNKYFWHDLLDYDFPMIAKVSYTNIQYSGYIHLYSSNTDSPHLALAAYISITSDGKICNKTEASEEVIILDVSKANSVEIFYDERSSKCNEIKDLIETNIKRQQYLTGTSRASF